MPAKPECPTEEELSAFLQGGLSAERSGAIESHLATCDDCARRVDVMRRERSGEPLSDTSASDQTDSSSEPGETQPLDSSLASLDVLDAARSLDYLGELINYDVVKVLGRGGYGVVYEAMDNVLHRKVAIKVLTRDLASQATSRRRFIREARACAAINHPNIVTIHSVDEAQDIPFIVMELIQGESLQERIRHEPRMDFMDALRVSAQVAQGLAAAHAQGIIHRDVKPGNIMLVDSVPRVKITDFGLARISADNLELTSHGFAVGTPAYMSPEQVRGEDLDARSDLFALGCVMYAMISGHSPFHGRSALDVARRIEDQDPRPLQEVNSQTPEFLDTIVKQLLQKKPEDRFQSAAEVADLLNRHLSILHQVPSDRLSEAMRMPLLKTSRSRWHSARWIAIAAIALLVLLGAWQGWLPWRSDRPTPSTAGRLARGVPSTSGETEIPAAPVPRVLSVTVAQSGDADCTTIGEALRRIAPGGTVTIEDSGDYEETIRLADPNLYTDVQILSPQHATVRTNIPTGVITIDSVPGVRLEGLNIEAMQCQLGIDVRGVCPGLFLTGLTVHRRPNPAGRNINFAGLALRHGASGSPEEPIVIRDVSVTDTVVGLVIGNPSAEHATIKHVVIEQCLVRGLARDTSSLVVLLRNMERVALRHNIFAHGSVGLSMLVEDQACPVNCEVSQNTWHDLRTWIGWTGLPQSSMSLQLHDNLIVAAGQVVSSARSMASSVNLSPSDNVAVISKESDRENFAPLATACDGFPFLSLDPSQPEYLKPDFDRVAEQGFPPTEVPGRYSSPPPAS